MTTGSAARQARTTRSAARQARTTGRASRWVSAAVVALALWLGSAGLAGAETSPTPTEPPSSNPFADLQPVSLLMWLGSALVALVAVLYAVDRERRKHDG